MAEQGADQEVARIQGRLADLEAERTSLERRLADLLSAPPLTAPMSTVDAGEATSTSGGTDKVTLFRRLFAGRQDVYPLRWENAKTGRSGYAPACANEWVKSVCGKPQVKCGECPNQAFIPVSDEVIENHLRGKDRMRPRAAECVAGVYPLLLDETCRFLAADFDGESWAADALAYMQTCRAKGVPAALERSRSGEGGHVWIFFSEPVPARDARQLGALLLTETMERRPEIGFASYDRFFPSQDTMPTRPTRCVSEPRVLPRAGYAAPDLRQATNRVLCRAASAPGSRAMGSSSWTSAITCPPRASSWWHDGQRPGTSLGCPRRSPGKTGTTRSSSCSVVRCGTGSIPSPRPHSGVSSIACAYARRASACPLGWTRIASRFRHSTPPWHKTRRATRSSATTC